MYTALASHSKQTAYTSMIVTIELGLVIMAHLSSHVDEQWKGFECKVKMKN